MEPGRVRGAWVRRVAMAFLVAFLPGCARPPDFPTGSVESVDIELNAWGTRQKAARARSADAGKIEALLAVLRKAKLTEDHKCGDTGRLTFRRKDGSEVKFGILAGHDERYHEFRAYKGSGYRIFRVQRAPFLKAMRDLNAGDLDLGKAG